MKLSTMSFTQRKKLSGLLFCLPFIIGFLLLYLMPFVRSVYYSFHEVRSSAESMVFEKVGWSHYERALTTDTTFVRSITDGLVTNLFVLFPLIMLFSLFVAVVLNQKFKGRVVARVVFFMPVVLYSGVISSLFDRYTGDYFGIISGETSSGSLSTLNLVEGIMNNLPFEGETLTGFVTAFANQVTTVVTMSGVQILIFLSGLQSISPSIYEACEIEGANGWEKFWKVTFPMISPMILVNAVYTLVDRFMGESNPVSNRIANLIRQSDFGYGAAMNMVYMVVVVAVISVVSLLVSRLVFYENR